MTRPPHTYNPAYRPRQTLSGLVLFGLLWLGFVALVVAPLYTLLAVLGLAVVGSGLRAVLRNRRRADRQRTVCVPLTPVCITA